MIKLPTPATQLNEVIASTADSEILSFVKDLKDLQKNFKKFKAKDFLKSLDTLIIKYESAEAFEAARVRAALVKRAVNGDIKAIELYSALQKENENKIDEVVILDNI